MAQTLEGTTALHGSCFETLLVLPVTHVSKGAHARICLSHPFLDLALLQTMLESTPALHPDHQLLVDAVGFCQEASEKITEEKHKAENVKDLQEVQAKWINFKDNLAAIPQRRLVKEGPVLVNKEKVHMWLFSDIVVVTKEKKKDVYSFVKEFQLKAATIQSDDTLTFRLTCTTGNFYVTLPTPTEKLIWETLFKENLTAVQAELFTSVFVDQYANPYQKSKFLQDKNDKQREATWRKLLTTEKSYVAHLNYTVTVRFLQI